VKLNKTERILALVTILAENSDYTHHLSLREITDLIND